MTRPAPSCVSKKKPGSPGRTASWLSCSSQFLGSYIPVSYVQQVSLAYFLSGGLVLTKFRWTPTLDFFLALVLQGLWRSQFWPTSASPSSVIRFRWLTFLVVAKSMAVLTALLMTSVPSVWVAVKHVPTAYPPGRGQPTSHF